MEIPSSDILKLLFALLPGFVVAFLFYGLTAHLRPSQFERTIQALIFTGVVQIFVLVFRELMFLFGLICRLGDWTDNVPLVTSFAFAIFLGLLLSAAANNNWLYPLLQRWNITQRSSYPSEWFSALSENQRYVTLHLTDGRRIFGWPYEWPNQCDSGHFVLMEASWLTDENETISLPNVHMTLIPAKDVEIVELLK
jgi:hypothetical protein